MAANILVVEDEPDINKTVSYNIANEGLKPLSALNLTEAESYISSNNISLIILDLMLPDGSGLDFCKKLKSSNAYSEIPIIIVTAKDDEVDKVVADGFAKINEYENKVVFGHSVGGQVALHSILTKLINPDFLILSAPTLGDNYPKIIKTLSKSIANIFPKLRIKSDSQEFHPNINMKTAMLSLEEESDTEKKTIDSTTNDNH